MDLAAQTSAVAQHAAHCSGRLHARVLCRESEFMIRKVKEALKVKEPKEMGHNSWELHGGTEKRRTDQRSSAIQQQDSNNGEAR
ncbi:hypothetical protein M513_07387 [Trichuris suis]|uniref:Uncharacterized protein n=1 Tax=Trichuris suis TaxID=68888 RepID=A0A085M395_9BILA|nr:hypothetical protein M513_07387 [Trichuris suis]